MTTANTVFLCFDFFFAGAFTAMSVGEWSNDNTREATKFGFFALSLLAVGISRALR